MNIFAWAVKSLKKRGPGQTIKIGLSCVVDLSFDFFHGTETRAWVPLTDLDLQSENVAHGVTYQASKAAPVLKLLKSLGIPKDGGFVDFGSGKGRVLMLAAKSGFANIVGVEFSHELCAIARQNLDIFTRRTGIKTRIEIVTSDAAHFRIAGDQIVFFMFNPFNGFVMEQVLFNIRESVRQFPRKVWLIYNTPAHSDTVLRTGLFSASQRYQIGGNDFVVFQN